MTSRNQDTVVSDAEDTYPMVCTVRQIGKEAATHRFTLDKK